MRVCSNAAIADVQPLIHPVSMQHYYYVYNIVCKSHTLSLYILYINRPEHQVVICATQVRDKCVYMDLAQSTGHVFVSHLANRVEVE